MVVAALAASGCRAAYLTRLAWEEARYLASAEPASRLAATTADEGRRRALEALLAVREFARAEGLDVGGSYREVARVDSASPFHVVTAAPVDRLEPFTWWYPVIGAIPYRGYFDRAEAGRFADGLRRDGLDVRIVEASAYSTLGWFDDPLPSSVLDGGEREVVVTVLHELVHQTFFAPGDVAFNETLATAVSYRLAASWWDGRGDAASAAWVRAAHARWLARGDALDAAAQRLRELFDAARAQGLGRDALLERRASTYAAVVEQLRAVDPAFAAAVARGGLDNASFLAVHRYATRARGIDGFVASHASVAAALEALREAHRRGVAPFDAVQAAPAGGARGAAGGEQGAEQGGAERGASVADAPGATRGDAAGKAPGHAAREAPGEATAKQARKQAGHAGLGLHRGACSFRDRA